MGNIDSKKMQKMMKKMGVEEEEIDAEEVVIKRKDGSSIIISSPDVAFMSMMGQEFFRVSGEISEGSQEEAISEEDVEMIMEKTGEDKETVEQTLKKLNNDLAKTIMELKKERK